MKKKVANFFFLSADVGKKEAKVGLLRFVCLLGLGWCCVWDIDLLLFYLQRCGRLSFLLGLGTFSPRPTWEKQIPLLKISSSVVRWCWAYCWKAIEMVYFCGFCIVFFLLKWDFGSCLKRLTVNWWRQNTLVLLHFSYFWQLFCDNSQIFWHHSNPLQQKRKFHSLDWMWKKAKKKA